MANRSLTHRRLLYGMTATVFLTCFFYFWRINWKWHAAGHHLLSGVFEYFIYLSIAITPYFLLALLLERTRQSPMFQYLVFFSVVALPAYFHLSFLFGNRNTAGWDLVIVPFLQFILVSIAFGISFVLTHFAPLAKQSSNVSSHQDT